MKSIVALLGILAAVCSAAAEPPLNIVIVYADDWRHDTLGCAGNPVVKTPQVDALARDGFRFKRRPSSRRFVIRRRSAVRR